MRTISADANAMHTAVGGRSEFIRVWVKDAGGTFRDLTTYALNHNLVTSATWRETIDDPGLTADITLKREEEMLSIAPLIATSALNLAFAYPGSFTALLSAGAEVKIDQAVVAEGNTPQSGDWVMAFHGYLDTVDWAAEEVALTCRGLQAKLMDTWVETERVYAFAQPSGNNAGCRIWSPGMVAALNELAVGTDANRNGFFFKCTTAGTAGATEPLWPGAGTVSDGGIVWTLVSSVSTSAGTAVETVMQQILNDNGLSAVTLNVPVSSGWNIRSYLQQRQSVWDALKALADQIGYDLRYKWNGSTDFALTFYAPNRSVSTPDRTFAASEYADPTKLAVDVAEIRNAVQIVWSNSQSLDAGGNPIRTTTLVTDSTSIAKYGRRFMEAAEASTSNIDSSSEATAMANACLSDLKEPNADAETAVRFFPFVELNDYYRFSPNGVHSTNNLDLAVVGYEHTFPTVDQTPSTKLTLRGKPTVGTAGWLNKDGRVNAGDVHRVNNLGGGSFTLSTQPVVGGTQLSVNPGTGFSKNVPAANYEMHISTSAGFTPSPATFVGSGQARQIVLPGLIPGKQYYYSVVPFGWNASKIVRGQPSPAVGFIAGQAAAGHISSLHDVTRLPLNGGFETNSDSAGPPDHWSVSAGTWATNISLVTSSAGISGDSFVTFSDVAVTRSLDSDIFVVEAGSPYEMSFWINEHNISINGQLTITWLDNTKAVISSTSKPSDTNALASWQQYYAAVQAPSNARFAKLSVQTVSGANAHGFDVDLVQFRRLHLVGSLTFGASSFPTANGTTFMQPGGCQGTNLAAALGILLPTRTGSRMWLNGFTIKAQTNATNITSYVITDPNGPLSLTWNGTGSTGESTSWREVRPLPVGTGNKLDIQVVTTIGAGPTGGTNILATYGIWN